MVTIVPEGRDIHYKTLVFHTCAPASIRVFVCSITNQLHIDIPLRSYSPIMLLDTRREMPPRCRRPSRFIWRLASHAGVPSNTPTHRSPLPCKASRRRFIARTAIYRPSCVASLSWALTRRRGKPINRALPPLSPPSFCSSFPSNMFRELKLA